MVERSTIAGLASAAVGAALVISASSALQTFPTRGQLRTIASTALPTVNRAEKGDRIPQHLPLPPRRPIVRTKLPVGCDPSISPLTGVRSESNPATYCTS